MEAWRIILFVFPSIKTPEGGDEERNLSCYIC